MNWTPAELAWIKAQAAAAIDKLETQFKEKANG